MFWRPCVLNRVFRAYTPKGPNIQFPHRKTAVAVSVQALLLAVEVRQRGLSGEVGRQVARVTLDASPHSEEKERRVSLCAKWKNLPADYFTAKLDGIMDRHGWPPCGTS